MGFLDAIILGIIEGITEFLPISSTGHLILGSKILGLAETDFLKSFEIAIQLGAIFAVIFLYWKIFFSGLEVLKKITVAFIPTAVLGVIFYKLVKQYLLGSQEVVLWALFIGGIFLIIFEIFYKEKPGAVREISEISYGQAAIIGIFQSVAMIPGVSRAAATIIGGLTLGLGRKTIVEFSFLLAVPTMIAATGLDFVKSVGVFSAGQFWVLAVGAAAAFFTAVFSIKLLLRLIKNNSFISFGIYRVILAVIFWSLLI